MSLRNFFFFGRKAKQPKVSAGLKIVFHNDTRGLGMHGTLIASHVDHKLNNEPVRFTFVGMHEAPPLTPEMMEFIWYKAESAGFMVNRLATYGSVMDTVKASKISDVVSQDRLTAESRFPAQNGQSLPPYVAQSFGRTLGGMGMSLLAEQPQSQPAPNMAPVRDPDAPIIHPPAFDSQKETATPVMAQ